MQTLVGKRKNILIVFSADRGYSAILIGSSSKLATVQKIKCYQVNLWVLLRWSSLVFSSSVHTFVITCIGRLAVAELNRSSKYCHISLYSIKKDLLSPLLSSGKNLSIGEAVMLHLVGISFPKFYFWLRVLLFLFLEWITLWVFWIPIICQLFFQAKMDSVRKAVFQLIAV